MKDKLQYRGKVKLDTMKKGRRINSVIHNTGLPDMSWLFAKAVTGNLDSSRDVPRVLDLGYVMNNTSGSADGIWQSILNTPVNIGGRQYSYDASLENWVGELIGTIYYTDLNGPMIDDVIAQANDTVNSIQLKLRLCSYNPENRKYFAEVDVTPDDVTQIKEMTSVIVTWYSEIIPEANDESMDAGIISQSSN